MSETLDVNVSETKTENEVVENNKQNENNKPDEKVDVRYIRENATKVCEVSLEDMNIYMYVDKEHTLHKELGKQFSVYQDIYSLDKFYNDILGIKTIDWNDVDEDNEEIKEPEKIE